MPKPPPIEYFMLRAPTPKPLLGDAVAALTKLGLTEINFDLIADVPAYKSRNNPEISSIEYLRTWIADHPTFRANNAVKHFLADGRTKGNAYPALSALVNEGVLKKLAPGQYSRADIKHLANPKKKDKEKPKPKEHDTSHPDFVLRAARRNHGRFNTAWMKRAFERDGRTPAATSPTLSSMLTKKLIKRVGEGEYVLAEAKPKPNGKLDTPVAAEASNG